MGGLGRGCGLALEHTIHLLHAFTPPSYPARLTPPSYPARLTPPSYPEF